MHLTATNEICLEKPLRELLHLTRGTHTLFLFILTFKYRSKMVQMTARDQMVIKAIPGNNQCVDCGMKNPDWASVSFGTIFCLECSGVHR